MNTPAQVEVMMQEAAVSARAAEAVNRLLARRERIDDEITDAVETIAEAVTAGARDHWLNVDPDATILASTSMTEAVRACYHRAADDARDTLRIALGKIVYALTRIAESEPVSADRDPKEIARWLIDHAEVPQAEVAGLLGTPLRTLQRWASPNVPTAPTGEDATRLRLLAQLVSQLRHVFTPAGAVIWLRAPNGHLKGQSPIEVIAGDPARAPAVVELARSLRFQPSG
jgi:uncharacterized protein (DUF2384 family)